MCTVERQDLANIGQYNFVCSKFQLITDGERSLSFSSVKLSNGLPYEIKRRNSLLSFKNALKTYFSNSYIDIDKFWNLVANVFVLTPQHL